MPCFCIYSLSHAVGAEWLFVPFGEGGKDPGFVRPLVRAGKARGSSRPLVTWAGLALRQPMY